MGCQWFLAERMQGVRTVRTNWKSFQKTSTLVIGRRTYMEICSQIECDATECKIPRLHFATCRSSAKSNIIEKWHRAHFVFTIYSGCCR